MTKAELIELLSSIELVYFSEEYATDRVMFEPLVTSKPEMGIKCLYAWMSHYYISMRSKSHIEQYAISPTWDNFQRASFFLMLDRVIAAVALDGQVVSQVDECIRYTLKPGYNIDQETYNWVALYARLNKEQEHAA